MYSAPCNSLYRPLRYVRFVFALTATLQAAAVWGSDAPAVPSLSDGARAALARSYLDQGKAYEYGEGAARDPELAARYYCDAARLGDAEALYSLGWLYASGRGVVRHVGYAATLLSMAAAQGHVAAGNALRRLGEPSGEQPECMTKVATAREVSKAATGSSNATPATLDELVNADAADLDAYIAGLPANKQKIAELIRLLAPQYGINPRLALAIAVSESNLDLLARSSRGALGVMQLIPDTAARFKVRNTFDPGQNIRGGLSYLRWLLAYYRGDVLLAVAAYNAGEGAVDRFRGIPPFMETAFYVKKIYAFYKQPQHPFDATLTEPSPVVAAGIAVR
ncbi:transglycosylase SLT domain-containing protein [Uliginosibacterium sp. H3]|uniref:Transglycosylase SLT domain-containing protein n=1 Tax=Uliginosibacterium silvisoli TaxID=3114758 RepID=A0ABU6K6Q6_9RHOO|nr:transglycosylase SLT domain-containing protein [Uliginosibacterium sp. H3]